MFRSPVPALRAHDQLNAATELGLLIVTSFEENDREVDDVRLSQLKRVATAMTPGVEMSEFLKRAIRYARERLSGVSAITLRKRRTGRGAGRRTRDWRLFNHTERVPFAAARLYAKAFRSFRVRCCREMLLYIPHYTYHVYPRVLPGISSWVYFTLGYLLVACKRLSKPDP